jgi:hypothetical protein
MNMLFQNLLRVSVYSLLFIFNTVDLTTAWVGFGFMFVLHLFGIYVDIKNSVENSRN